MLDPTRWIVAEMWLDLGLRLRWASRYEMEKATDDHWVVDDGDDERRSYFYVGGGVWVVGWLRTGGYYRSEPVEPPQLSSATLIHEMAHWMVSSAEAREKKNMGMTIESYEQEERALDAQRGIEACIRASAKIACMALGGRSR